MADTRSQLQATELEVDQDGSPVSLEPGSWFVCFVPGLVKQWWHPFVHKVHKHVFAMRPADPGEWTLFEPWWTRLLTATITSAQARKFLLWGARGDVLLVREAIPGRGSQVRGWMTCAALASYLLGRAYWVWTPHGLYERLLREPNVCRVDVSVLLTLTPTQLGARDSRVIAACDACSPDAPKPPGDAEALLHAMRPRPPDGPVSGPPASTIEPLPCCAEHRGVECVPWPTGEADAYALFFEGDDLYDAMVASIGAARDRVDLETYIYAADDVGWRIAEALASRARAGVAVRVLVDAAGSFFSFSRRLEGYLRREGVVVHHFHRWRWRRPLRFYRRDHRKLLAIDGREAFVGGYNVHRESSRVAYGERRWRDTHVRLGGRLAEQAGALFDTVWAGDRGGSPQPADATGDALVPNHSRICRRQVHCLYLRLLRSARLRIYLTTPYFVPDHRTQNELVNAAARGVDVRLLLPGKSDVPVTQWAARAAYQKLLAAGVRVFEYRPRVLHAKTAVVDGAVATVGTANLDYRSLFVNYELNLFSGTRALCAALERQFLADLAEADEVTAPRWSRRPWISLVVESIGWMARRWL